MRTAIDRASHRTARQRRAHTAVPIDPTAIAARHHASISRMHRRCSSWVVLDCDRERKRRSAESVSSRVERN
jgi:hypothetical protein